MIGRCQICGRKTATRKDGGLRFHHVAGVPCEGAGFPPIELEDRRLEERIAELEHEAERITRELRELEERRANWIDPHLRPRRALLWGRAARLARRLRRHRNWPERYRRQFARYGYASPPPAYLLEREQEAPR